MSDIIAAKKKIMDFITKELAKEATQFKFVKISKTPEGWSGKVEITEDNAHMKKLGYPSIFEKNSYQIDLDDALEVTNFCREGEEY